MLLMALPLMAFSQTNEIKKKFGRSFGNDGNNAATIGLNSVFACKMMEQNQNLRKMTISLEERKTGALKNRSLIFGASLIFIFDYQKSNTADKFGYLMRHPTGGNQVGREVSELAIHSFQLSTTMAVNDWVTAYAEILYNPEQSLGAGTTTALTRNQ